MIGPDAVLGSTRALIACSRSWVSFGQNVRGSRLLSAKFADCSGAVHGANACSSLSRCAAPAAACSGEAAMPTPDSTNAASMEASAPFSGRA